MMIVVDCDMVNVESTRNCPLAVMLDAERVVMFGCCEAAVTAIAVVPDPVESPDSVMV